ncbi:MAG: hypothetical protein H6816_15915 [Phycisphaerales bacterium]|nr:hypothetical protein [Phycisphaerales bacterium]
MTTPQLPRLGPLADRRTLDRDQRRRTPASGPARRARIATVMPSRPLVSSITRDVEQLCASWTSEYACFELVVRSHSTDLQVKLCTWLNSGPALEERFVIHTLAEFEQWIAKAPTKFDHPVAHEEIKRFAHGTLAR